MRYTVNMVFIKTYVEVNYKKLYISMVIMLPVLVVIKR